MDKIDIRDLRVGNWLSVHHPTMPAEYIQISADWIRTIEQINDGLIKEDSPLFRIVEPIPITEEILIQNGFPEDEWHGSFPEDKNGLLYIALSFNKIFWEFNDCRIEIKSVHQLQNLLRDLGINKEITI